MYYTADFARAEDAYRRERLVADFAAARHVTAQLTQSQPTAPQPTTTRSRAEHSWVWQLMHRTRSALEPGGQVAHAAGGRFFK